MTISASSTSDVSPSAEDDKTSVETNEIRLRGCSPTPLAHYLKALAVLRIVDEQLDSNVRGWWDGSDFLIRTVADESELIEFFANEYAPTPIASPWNGGSGFKRNKIRDEVADVRDSEAERLGNYRQVIGAAFKLLEDLGIEGKVSKDDKDEFLQGCRSRFPEEALPWLDAAYVLTGDRTAYPAVLGTGGNDGNLEFGLNFMRRLATVFDYDTGEPIGNSANLMRAALFKEPQIHLQTDGSIGQFLPHAAGGTNQTTGFDADTVSNPWDFILMLEGAVYFSAAAVRQLESAGPASLSVPFSARHIGVGHPSADASEEDDARDELWVPLWSKPTTARELDVLMSEGRVRLGRSTAGDGIDFARAISTLGVDRGISEFHRYGFQQRNGRAFFATPLNRIEVKHRPRVELIDEIDGWLDKLSRESRKDGVPGSIQSVTRNIQEAVFRLCQHDDPIRVRQLLVALGKGERQLAKSFEWTTDNWLKPLSGLSAQWLEDGYDGTAEFRLAASLATVYGSYGSNSLSIREQFEPVQYRGAYRWKEQVGRDVVWHDGDPVDALGKVMGRRLLLATQSGCDTWPDTGQIYASLHDVAAFIDGRLDIQRLVDLLWGMLAIDTSKIDEPPFELPDVDAHPGALYALTKLCFAGVRKQSESSETDAVQDGDVSGVRALADIPIVASIHRHLMSGDTLRATKGASRRLRGSSFAPVIDQFDIGERPARRCAAALLFPLSFQSLAQLQDLALRRED